MHRQSAYLSSLGLPDLGGSSSETPRAASASNAHADGGADVKPVVKPEPNLDMGSEADTPWGLRNVIALD